MNLARDRWLRAWVVICLCTSLVTAQITFSRDWNGGKRSGPTSPIDASQFNRVCRHFLHELKQMVGKEMRSHVKSRPPRPQHHHHRPDDDDDNDDSANSYDD